MVNITGSISGVVTDPNSFALRVQGGKFSELSWTGRLN
jgi:hypothetical protein